MAGSSSLLRGVTVVSRVGTTLAVLLAILVLASPASAQLDAVAGVTYNTYTVEEDLGRAVQPFKSGLGFYGGVQYWISDAVAVGAQIEHLSTGEAQITGGDAKFTSRMTSLGFLATATYHLDVSDAFYVRPFLGAGVYKAQWKFTAKGQDETATFETKPSFAAKLGAQVGTDITSNLSVTGVVGYRFVSDLKPKDGEGEMDWFSLTGLTFGGGLTYHF